MGGPSPSAEPEQFQQQQIAAPDLIGEAVAQERGAGIWDVVDRVVADLLTQQVSGGVVLLIVGLCLFFFAYRDIRARWLRKRNSKDD